MFTFDNCMIAFLVVATLWLVHTLFEGRKDFAWGVMLGTPLVLSGVWVLTVMMKIDAHRSIGSELRDGLSWLSCGLLTAGMLIALPPVWRESNKKV